MEEDYLALVARTQRLLVDLWLAYCQATDPALLDRFEACHLALFQARLHRAEQNTALAHRHLTTLLSSAFNPATACLS